MEKISYEEFRKVQLRTATVKKVENHPNADKLYVLTINLGNETRQIVAGMKPYYNPDEMEGKLIIIVANLEPAKLRGVESNGMLLAADDGKGKVILLTTDKKIDNGVEIK